jgi:hypothetical protein
MYLTAQRVRRTDGLEPIHSFLHLHGAAPFPADPLSVPQHHPGQIVKSNVTSPGGGNDVLSYLDVIARDGVWNEAARWRRGSSSDWWYYTLEPFAELMGRRPLPWVIEAGAIHVIFNAAPRLRAVEEYDGLLRSAVSVWDAWRLERGMP